MKTSDLSHVASKLTKIQLIIVDVDGVLTDGIISYGDNGLETKSFHSQDGFGIALGHKAGLRFAVLTGRNSEAVDRRVAELEFDYYEAGHFYKRDALRTIMQTAGLLPEQVLYMGDDILDLVCQSDVALFVAPANAVDRVKTAADWVTEKSGGCGAVREVIDAILVAQDKLTETENYFIDLA